MDLPILSLILWSPLVFGVLLLLVPSEPIGVRNVVSRISHSEKPSTPSA